MAASTYLAQVQQLYIAYFGRPADPIGQAYWAGIIDAAGGNIAAVQAGFSASAESQALFGNKSTIDKVTAIYQNAFGRAPEPAGLAYWVAQLDSGKVTQAQASWTIQQSAGAGDAAAVQNKLTAAQAFTAQIDTTAEIQGYQGAGAAAAGVAFLATVNQTNASATAAVANAASALATAVAAGGTVGTTFALTAGVDTLNGTANNDTFVADNTGTTKFLSTTDTINGGAGVDTLKVFLAAADTGFATPTLSGVENVQIVGGGVGTFTAIAGTTGLIVDTPATAGSTYVLSGQALTLKGATVGANTTTTVDSTADTAANVTLNGWNAAATFVSTLDLKGTKVAAATLTATGANSAITLTNTGTALKTLNIAGDKNIAVVANAAVTGALTSINASTASGAVSVDLSAANTLAAFTFVGGAGNDTLTLGANELATLTAGSQLDGGAGTDTLVVGNTTFGAADYTKLNAVKGFEALGLVASATVDASSLTSIKAFSVTAATDTISNLGAGSSVSLTGAASATTLGAALGNTATEVSVGAAGAAGLNVGTLTTTGLTSLGLTSNGTSVNTVALGNSDNTTVTVKGATDLVLTLATASSTGSTINAAAFTGKLTVTGTQFADNITGGSGADIIIGGAGNDTLTGGAGADKFVVDKVSVGGMDWIKDFVAGTDKIITTGLSTSTTAVSAVVDKGALSTTTYASLDLAVASFASGGANVTAANTAYTFTYGGDNYVLVDNAGVGYTAAADSLIKVTGITGTLTAADIITA
jgi:Ca2+-binding RTX toxin-like protein